MTRRSLLALFAGFGLSRQALAATGRTDILPIQALRLPDAEWKRRLSPAQYKVLRQEGTEPPHSSALNSEKRKGVYHCAACDLPLFSFDMKYDSGTGWPSFFTSLPGAVLTKIDFKLVFPRTEYHCARCEGHQGHVFNDAHGPPESATAITVWHSSLWLRYELSKVVSSIFARRMCRALAQRWSGVPWTNQRGDRHCRGRHGEGHFRRRLFLVRGV